MNSFAPYQDLPLSNFIISHDQQYVYILLLMCIENDDSLTFLHIDIKFIPKIVLYHAW